MRSRKSTGCTNRQTLWFNDFGAYGPSLKSDGMLRKVEVVAPVEKASQGSN